MHFLLKLTSRPRSASPGFLFGPAFGEWLVSHKIKEAIEGLEPRMHQMLAVELIMQQDLRKLFEDNRYYLLNSCVRLNAIDVANSTL